MELDIARIERAFGGISFGRTGPYEQIIGRARDAVDPAHPRYAGIVNVDRAPRDADGRVPYSVDFCLLKPVDMSRSNGCLLYDAPNRGDKLALIDINSAIKGPASNALGAPEDAGNGFLMRRGYVVAFSAWQGGVAPGEGHLLADFPFATDDADPVVATTREEIIFAHTNSPARWPLPYPAHGPDRGRATLTVRQYEADAREPVPGGRWRFRSDREIEVDLVEGFDAGAIYELVYAACEPTVLGLGLASVRDLVALLRSADADANGVANPLNVDGRPPFDRALAYGRSQPGRFLREFLRLGFNEAADGSRVFDGVYVTLPGSRRMAINEPFAQLGRFPRHHEDHLFPGDQFPFTYATRTDSFSGETGGIVERCRATDTCPKVMHVDTSTEFWQGRSSLVVSDEQGRDVELPDEVRAYLLAGTGHAGPAMLGHAAAYHEPARHAVNLHDYAPLCRALMAALDEWVRDGTPPPPTRYPSVGEGTLVPPRPREGVGFPEIPGVAYPGIVNGLSRLDVGTQPPTRIPGQDYPVLVPAVDADGNEISGIRSPDVIVPVGTYTGWNLRGPGFAEGVLMIVGAFIPFAATAAERRSNGDPRPSLEERYPDHERYVAAVRAAARQLTADRLLLEEDAERYVATAQASDIGR